MTTDYYYYFFFTKGGDSCFSSFQSIITFFIKLTQSSPQASACLTQTAVPLNLQQGSRSAPSLDFKENIVSTSKVGGFIQLQLKSR